MHRIRAAMVFVVCSQGLAGCGSSYSVPSAPSSLGPPPSSGASLAVFTDPRSGFSTSDVRDADDQVVQFNDRELIWSDGTRLSGYFVRGNTISAESSCPCWLVVRFGISGGERRAYMTMADYGHDNPGTLVDLEIAGNALVVKRTTRFAPGTYTLSGVIREVTDKGPTPVEGADVYRTVEELTGAQWVKTDANGFYMLGGLYAGGQEAVVIKDGYQTSRSVLAIDGDTRLDIEIVRR